MSEPVDPVVLNQIVSDIAPIGVMPSGGALHSGDWNVLVRAVAGIAEQLGADAVTWSEVARTSRSVGDVAEGSASGADGEDGVVQPQDPTLRAELERLRSSVNMRTEATRLAMEQLVARLAALESGASSSGGGGDTAALEARLASVEGTVSDIKAKVEQHDSDLSEVGGRLKTVATQSLASAERIEELSATVKALKEEVARLASSRETGSGSSVTEADFGALKERLAAVGAELGEQDTQLREVGSSVAKLTVRVSALEGNTTTLSASFDGKLKTMRELLATEVAPISELRTRLGSAESGLADLDTSLSGKLKALGGKITTAEDQLGGLATRVDVTERGVSSLGSWKTSADANIRTLGDAQAAAERALGASIASVDSKVDSQVASLTSSLSSVTTRLGSAERSVSSLSSSVGTLSTDYSALTRTVNNLDSAMVTLSAETTSIDYSAMRTVTRTF